MRTHDLDLEAFDALGGCYPSFVRSPTEQIRWNQSRMIAVALAALYEPGMPMTEFKYTMAASIYRQPEDEFPTGDAAELAEEIAGAKAQGWL